MNYRRLELFFFPLPLLLVVLYWSGWFGPQASLVKELTRAEFSLLRSGQAGPDASPASREVGLPHYWSVDEQQDEATGIYQVPIPSDLASGPVAISMSDAMPGIEVTYAGKFIPQEDLTGRLNKVVLAKLGEVMPGEVIQIRVRSAVALRSGLDSIKIGPESIIERQAWVISATRYLGRAGALTLPFMLGVFSFFLYCVRAGPVFLSLSFAALSYAFQQGWLDLLGYWEKDDFQLALYLFLSLNVVFGFCLALLQVTKKKLDVAIGMALIFFPLVGLLLFTQTGSLEFRRIVTSLALTICFGHTMIRSGPRLVRLRYWFLVSLSIVIGMRLVYSCISVVVNHGMFSFASQNKQMLLTTMSMVLMFFLFAGHLEKSLKRFRLTNKKLQEEIDTYKQSLADAAKQAEKFAAEHAAARERDYWLREIHDGLGSHLIAARLITDKLPDNREVLNTKSSIDDCIEQLRMLVESLSPEPASIPSLLGAMRYRMMGRLHSAGLECRWDVDPMIEGNETSPMVALHVQRIIAEAIANVLKHAQASIISIHIFSRDKSIVIRIDDNGIGFNNLKTGRGHGISGMKMRAKQCGGDIRWTPLDPGTRVELRVPDSIPAGA